MPRSRGGRDEAPALPAPEGALSDLFDLSELLGDFRDEARDPIARLDAVLAAWERGETLAEPDRTPLLRGLHTLKGNAGMLGLRPIQDFVHSVESVLKRSHAPPPGATLAALLRGAAALRLAVDRAGSPEEERAFAALVPIREEPADAPGEPAPAPPEGDGEAPREAAPGPEVRAQDLRDDVVRIPFRKLDVLLDEIGEVMSEITALEEWEEAHRAALRAAGLGRALQDRVETMAAAADAARRTATDLRLVPVGRIFARFPALVRDLARDQGKRVRVVLEGEATRLDKSTADAVAEPLLHLVRNAVDHGIEPPEEREAAGKPPEAFLALRATQEGDRVRIEVEDDGRGLDRAGIVARAREQGIVPPEADGERAEELIFRPGFSTRREASAVSGRGIGLDAVRGAVSRLRGSVEVEEGEEGGTRFLLRLPLTVALVPALFFEAAGERLALPSADVEETLRAGEVERVGPAEVVRVRDEVLPLARPARIFGWDDGRPPRFLVVVRSGSRGVAVAADRLLEQRPATVRALPAAVGSPPGISGATVAPDGGVVLVLDPAAMVELNVDLYRGGGGGQ